MRQIIRKLITWVRWGVLRHKVIYLLDDPKYPVQGFIVFSCRTGQVIGAWYLGRYDTSFHYVGQPAFWSRKRCDLNA